MGEEQPDNRPGMKEFHVGEWWQPDGGKALGEA